MRGQRVLCAVCCVALILPGLLGGCRRKTASETKDPAVVAEKQIRERLNDLFAYIKTSTYSQIPPFSRDSEETEDLLQSLRQDDRKTAFDTAGGHTTMRILDLRADTPKATIRMEITCYDGEEILKKARETGGFSEEKALVDAIRNAPLTTKEITISMSMWEDVWTIASDDMEELLRSIYGFLDSDELLADEKETEPTDPVQKIFVGDSYFIDENKEETIAFHSSEKTICFYAYTTTATKDETIRYRYEDPAGNVLYENAFLMVSGTQWIACSWRPQGPIAVGEVRIHVLEESGIEICSASAMIVPDQAPLPYPAFVKEGFWSNARGEKVEAYCAEDRTISYTLTTSKPHQDLTLKYRFLNEQGQILKEDVLVLDAPTDTFVFTWALDEMPDVGSEENGEPTEQTTVETVEGQTDEPIKLPADSTIYLEITTSDDRPFSQAEIGILPEADPSAMPTDESESN